MSDLKNTGQHHETSIPVPYPASCCPLALTLSAFLWDVCKTLLPWVLQWDEFVKSNNVLH